MPQVMLAVPGVLSGERVEPERLTGAGVVGRSLPLRIGTGGQQRCPAQVDVFENVQTGFHGHRVHVVEFRPGYLVVRGQCGVFFG